VNTAEQGFSEPENNALVTISTVGLVSLLSIVDELAKTLGLTRPDITSEKGRGRLVALWRCSADVALEVERVVHRLPVGVSRTCELFVTLTTPEPVAAVFVDPALERGPAR
jgi:hypothetical protein